MRLILLNILTVVLLASCSTAYKAGQTPDDVYYSPVSAVAKKEENDDRKKDKYEEYNTAEDRFLRNKVRDRRRWSELDEYDYRYDCRYTYNYDYYRMKQAYYYSSGYSNCACACNSGVAVFHPAFYGYYTPWYGYNSYPYIIRNIAPSTYKPNLGGYHGGTYNNDNGIGNTIKKVFSRESGYSNRNSDAGGTYRPNGRSYTPSSSGGSRGGSSGGGGGSRVSRPGRP